jgi:Ca2+/Na+ antiporter
MTGFFLAIASSIPEFTTNSIASLNQNTSMLQFGMGAITGSGAYGKFISIFQISLYAWQLVLSS